MKNTKQIVTFTLNQIPTIRAVCLHKMVSNVAGVIAYLIKHGDGKTLPINHAINHYNEEINDLNKIIDKYKLGGYNGFYVAWNDIKNKTNEIDFNSICFANNLDANYIKGV